MVQLTISTDSVVLRPGSAGSESPPALHRLQSRPNSPPHFNSPQTLMNLKQACARNQAVWADAQLRAHGVDCRYSDLLWTCWESGVATSIHNEVITIASETDSQRGQTVREIE